jgi:hypothetical protein
MRSAPAWIEVLERTAGLPSETKRKLRADEAASVLADVLINAAFNATGAQCVVISMFSPDHIAGNCRAVVEGSRFAATELTLLAHALRHSRAAEFQR